MRIVVFVSLILISILAFVELTDGLRNLAPWKERAPLRISNKVSLELPPMESSDSATPVRPFGVTEGLSRWSVTDPFPETALLNGAMDMRPHPSAPNTWFVATFFGKVFRVQRIETRLIVTKCIDLAHPEFGWLYSIAIHPEFDQGKPFVYLFYRSNESAPKKYLRVVCCSIQAGAVCDAAQQEILIEQKIDHFEHIGGGMDFDDQGYLLIAVGDNGTYDDNYSHSQKITESLFSGVLRIDVDRRGGEASFFSFRRPVNGQTGGYYVPKDNPFVGDRSALAEFWALGFRNPFRLHFDAGTQSAWVGEVGQNRIEQLEKVQKGTNHLWSFFEGSEPFTRSYLKGERRRSLGRDAFPFYEYQHVDQDYCIVGGPVYRETLYPTLQGKVLFGDNQSGRIWAIDSENPSDKELLLRLPTGKRHASLTSICVDHDGRIFVTSFATGSERPPVLEVVPNLPKSMPRALSETGFFTSLTPLQAVPSFVPYEVNSPLWSDGLEKTRWFRLPEGGLIENSDDPFAHWKFPSGTIFIKHFANPSETGENARPIETRILIQGEHNSIYGATYAWNAEGTDGMLQLERKELTVPDAPIGPGARGTIEAYRLPSAEDCQVCHNPDNQNLGFYVAQLNRMGEDGIHQLQRFSEAGLLKSPYLEGSTLPESRLAGLNEADQEVEARIRSYLHSNCSFCHYPQGTQRTNFNASMRGSLAEAELVGADAKTFYMLIDGRETKKVVHPGRPEESLLLRRFTTMDREYSMPYLGRNSVHYEAAELMRTWIEQMK